MEKAFGIITVIKITAILILLIFIGKKVNEMIVNQKTIINTLSMIGADQKNQGV